MKEQLRAKAMIPLVTLSGIAGGLLAFIGIAASAVPGDPHWLDRSILLGLRNSADPSDAVGPDLLEEFFVNVTALGGRAVLGLVGVLVAGYLALVRQWASLGLVLVTLVGGSILSDAMKTLFERPRPDLVAHLVEVQSMSFPSGHATYSALAYLTFGALLARTQSRPILKLYVMATAVFLTLLVGFSRVFLGVHYPSDVLAGWCLGSAWAMACWFAVYLVSRRLESRWS